MPTEARFFSNYLADLMVVLAFLRKSMVLMRIAFASMVEEESLVVCSTRRVPISDYIPYFVGFSDVRLSLYHIFS